MHFNSCMIYYALNQPLVLITCESNLMSSKPNSLLYLCSVSIPHAYRGCSGPLQKCVIMIKNRPLNSVWKDTEDKKLKEEGKPNSNGSKEATACSAVCSTEKEDRPY